VNEKGVLVFIGLLDVGTAEKVTAVATARVPKFRKKFGRILPIF
jgi:hypothetical protein